MKKIILAVLISIIGFTASAKTSKQLAIEYADASTHANYRMLYAGHLAKVKNYCVGQDTKFIERWFIGKYSPYESVDFSTYFYNFLDLQLLTAIDKDSELQGDYFNLLHDAAANDCNVAAVIFYYLKN
jgi:hypothetical protein